MVRKAEGAISGGAICVAGGFVAESMPLSSPEFPLVPPTSAQILGKGVAGAELCGVLTSDLGPLR